MAFSAIQTWAGDDPACIRACNACSAALTALNSSRRSTCGVSLFSQHLQEGIGEARKVSQSLGRENPATPQPHRADQASTTFSDDEKSRKRLSSSNFLQQRSTHQYVKCQPIRFLGRNRRTGIIELNSTSRVGLRMLGSASTPRAVSASRHAIVISVITQAHDNINITLKDVLMCAEVQSSTVRCHFTTFSQHGLLRKTFHGMCAV